MIRPILAALALACCTLLGACNVGTSDLSALATSGVQPNLQPGVLTPATLSAAGVSTANQKKIFSGIATVKAVAARVCPLIPLGEGVANIVIAQTLTSSTVSNAAGLARIACTAVSGLPTYAALGSAGLVTGHVRIGRFDVPVYATRR